MTLRMLVLPDACFPISSTFLRAPDAGCGWPGPAVAVAPVPSAPLGVVGPTSAPPAVCVAWPGISPGIPARSAATELTGVRARRVHGL